MSYGNYPDLTHVKKILVIKLRHLGDVLLSTPVFSLLKKTFPEAEIDAYIYAESLPMLEGHPGISGFILYDSKWKKCGFFSRMQKEFKILKKIRRSHYDLVVNLTEGDRGALAARVSKGDCRVGFDPEGKGFLGKRGCYTHIVKNCKTPRHHVERNLDALRRIGIFAGQQDKSLYYYIPEDAKTVVNRKLTQAKVTSDFVVIHPASRWRFKCPDPQLIAQFIDQIDEMAVLVSGPDQNERLFIEKIISLVQRKEKVVNWAGELSLKELGALLDAAKCLLCVDSVSLHLASALKIPVVVLFGPTSEKNWGPWQHPDSKIVTLNVPCRPCLMDGCGGSKRSDCLYSLRVEVLLSAYVDVLAGSTAVSLCSLNSLATPNTE